MATSREASNTDWQNLDVVALEALVGSQADINTLAGIRGQDATVVVDLLDKALNLPNLSERLTEIYTFILRKICTACDILPSSHTLTGSVEMLSKYPLGMGGFADVWMGRHGNRKVAVKALRISSADDIRKLKKASNMQSMILEHSDKLYLTSVTQQFFKEVLVWKRLSHLNVLPFLGVTTTSERLYCMASSWMDNGTIMNYILRHPQANRIALISDIASGLRYLHSNGIIHADLKGANILMNNDYRAVLADFGLAEMVSTTSLAITNAAAGGTVRWMAPELLNPEIYGLANSKSSKESDVYAFGMVIYEVMTGKIPFYQFKNWAVTVKVIAGARPNRPADAVNIGLSGPLWQIVEDSWKHDPKERPIISMIFEQVNQITEQWNPPSPTGMDPQLEDGDDSIDSAASSDLVLHVYDSSKASESNASPANTTVPRGGHLGDARPNYIQELTTAFSDAPIRLEEAPPKQNIVEPPNPMTIVTDPVRESNKIGPALEVDRSKALYELAVNSLKRFDKTKRAQDIDEAIIHARANLQLYPPGHSDRSEALRSLAIFLVSCFNKTKRAKDIDEAIIHTRALLELCPPGHTDRSEALRSLAIRLVRRFDKTNLTKDVDEAIIHTRVHLELCPPGHTDRSEALRLLATHLVKRFDNKKAFWAKVEDLEEAIIHTRARLELCPPGHTDRLETLRSLAFRLVKRFDKTGRAEDIDEAINHTRTRFELCPPGHADRSEALRSLATFLVRRFDKKKRAKDIDEAIVHTRAHLELCPPGHTDHSDALRVLAIFLVRRFNKTKRAEDIDEAIIHTRARLELFPPGNTDRSEEMCSLADRLVERFDKTKKAEDIDEAIIHTRARLELCPPGHTDRSEVLRLLATHLVRRFEKTKGAEDIDEAIIHTRALLELCPPGHTDRSEALRLLATHLERASQATSFRTSSLLRIFR